MWLESGTPFPLWPLASVLWPLSDLCLASGYHTRVPPPPFYVIIQTPKVLFYLSQDSELNLRDSHLSKSS